MVLKVFLTLTGNIELLLTGFAGNKKTWFFECDFYIKAVQLNNLPSAQTHTHTNYTPVCQDNTGGQFMGTEVSVGKYILNK